jgi:hypothetical protein
MKFVQPERESEIRRYHARKTADGEFVVPLSVLALNCSNCRMVENERRPKGDPILYCAVCPVTKLRRKKEKEIDE